YFAAAGEGTWIVRLRPFLYAVPAGLLLLQPRLLERALNWVLARFKRSPIRVTLTWARVWVLLLGYAVAWCLMGAGFAALVRALTPLSWAQVPALVAVFTASYVIGFLSLLTPSGLGVREGVMTLLLATTLSAGVAAVVAIVARLWMVVGELIGVAFSLLTSSKPRAVNVGRDGTTEPALAVPAPLPPTPPPVDSSARSPVSSIGRYLPQLLLLLLILAYTVGFSAMSIRLHQAQLTHKSDLGQMDLAIWNTSRGRFVQEIKDDSVSTRLTDHVEPIFAPVSMLFWLWDDVRALLVLQSFALALGALPVFWLARSSVHSTRAGVNRSLKANRDPEHPLLDLASWFGLLAAFVYLMVPALQAANLTEFHAIPLAVPLILFACWLAERAHWVRFCLACLLLLAVKEEAALLALMLGLYVGLRPLARGLLRQRRASERASSAASSPITPHASHITSAVPRRTSRASLISGSLVVLLSALWFLVATFVIIPRHAGAAYGDAASVYFQRYGELGDSVADILRSLLTRPDLVWRTVTEPLRLRYLAGLLASVGFLPLLAPEILLLSAPLLAANLLSSYAAQYSGAFHYSAPLVPYLVIAAIIGARRLAQWTTTRGRMATSRSNALTRRWFFLILWLLAWSIGWQVAQGYTPIGREFRWPEVTDHHRLLARFTAQVPAQVPGSATAALYPHLTHREKLYLFPNVGDAQWVLLDVSGATDMHPVALRDQVLRMLDSGEWGVLDGADGYLLLVRGAEETRIPDGFYDFARSEDPQPEQPVSLSFCAPGGGSEMGPLQFLGYDVMDDEQWRLTTVRTYWQAQGSLPANVRVLPFFVANDGAVVEDTAERTPVGPLWYPPAAWSAGETIVIDTLPWFLPNHWGLAVGVSQGESWEQRDDRWQVLDASSVEAFDRSTWALLGVYE
ncbi:MAG TPA: DUF2079 domain-containing protein, partial [Anaerolineae bacterium]|nr:DUF2079 domain-containing protein [Anaerolineae bacterium]